MKNSLRTKSMVISASVLILVASFYVSYQQMVALPREREAIEICRSLGGYEFNLGTQIGYSPQTSRIESIFRWLKRIRAEIVSRFERETPHSFAFEEPVSDEDIEAIEYVRDIGRLELMSRGITDRTLARIAEPSRLYSLSIRQANITDNGLKSVRNAPLEYLEVVNTRATHASLFQLNLSKLRKLSVNLSLLSESTREVSKALATLESLRIFPDDPTPASSDWTFLRSFTRLNTLEIYAAIDDTAATELTQLSELNWLEVEGIHDRHLQGFNRLQKLESLTLTGDFTGSGLMNLSGSTIRTLAISSDELQDSSMAFLAGMLRLQRVDVKSPRLTVAGIAQLALCPNLESLEIEDANISDDDAIQFRLFPKLERLTLRNTRLTLTGARSIRASLPNLSLAISPSEDEGLFSTLSTKSR